MKEGSGANVLEVGDTMSKKGWHFAASQKSAAVHIPVNQEHSLLSVMNPFDFLPCIIVLRALMAPIADTSIADLKDAQEEVKYSKPGEKGPMDALYGLG